MECPKLNNPKSKIVEKVFNIAPVSHKMLSPLHTLIFIYPLAFPMTTIEVMSGCLSLNSFLSSSMRIKYARPHYLFPHCPLKGFPFLSIIVNWTLYHLKFLFILKWFNPLFLIHFFLHPLCPQHSTHPPSSTFSPPPLFTLLF